MKSWQVKMIIQSYLMFKERVEMENVVFFFEKDINYALASVNSESHDSAEKVALQQVAKILTTFMVVTNNKFECSIIETNEITLVPGTKQGFAYLPSSFIVRGNFPLYKVDEANRIFKLLHKPNKTGSSAYNYYVRGLNIELWPSEAFLNYFKAIELISGEYIDEAKVEKFNETEAKLKKLFEELENEIKKANTEKVLAINRKIYSFGFIELRRRIVIALKDLHLEEYESAISLLIELRNSIAHPDSTSQSRIISDNDLRLCKDITLKMILNYMEKSS